MSTAASSAEIREIQLIQKAATGDGDAFGMLFEKHFQTIYNYVLWLCNDPDQAEDLTQETFIRAHKSLSQLGPPWRIKPWLYRLAHNLFIDYARQKKPVHPLDPDAPLASSEDNPERQIMAGELSGPVRGALRRLAPNYREALVLREVQGFPYAEIAEVMGVSVDHVKVLLHRARASFKDHYSVGLLMEKQARRCTVLSEMLDAFQDGELTPAQQAKVREHVKDCAACQQRQREMAALLVLLGSRPVFKVPPTLQRALLNTPYLPAGTSVIGGSRGRARWTRKGIQQLAAVGAFGAGIVLAAWLMIHFGFVSPPPPPPGGGSGSATPTGEVEPAFLTPPPTDEPTATEAVSAPAQTGPKDKQPKPGDPTEASTSPGGGQATTSAVAAQCFCEVDSSTNAWDGNYVCATADGVTVSTVVDTAKCPTPVCGNGVVEGNEQCDASKCGGGAACNADCTCGQPSKPPKCTCIPITNAAGAVTGGYCKEDRSQKCTP